MLAAGVALGLERKVARHEADRTGLRRFVLRQHALVCPERIRAGRTLVVVELDDEHLGSVGRNIERHPRLRGVEALELGLPGGVGLCGRRRIAGRLGRCRRSRLAREQQNRRRRPRDEHRSEHHGQRALTESLEVADRATRNRRHGDRGGGARDQKQRDHRGVGDDAQHAHQTQDDERRVAEIEHDGQSDRRPGEEIGRRAFTYCRGAAQAGHREEPAPARTRSRRRRPPTRRRMCRSGWRRPACS